MSFNISIDILKVNARLAIVVNYNRSNVLSLG